MKDTSSTSSGRTGVGVSRSLLSSLLAEAAAAHPHECCGILYGTATRITAHQPARNVHPDPHRHFEIEPQALIDAHRAARNGQFQIAGYYHSHPTGSPEPSATDQAQSAGDGSVWAIIGEGRVALWRDASDGFAPLSYSVTGG